MKSRKVLFFFCFSLLFCIFLQANEKQVKTPLKFSISTESFTLKFGDLNFNQNQVKKYAASSVNNNSNIGTNFIASGIILLLLGIIGTPCGILMIYFNGEGLGFFDDPKIKVVFWNDNRGYAGYWLGVSLTVLSGLMFVIGLVFIIGWHIFICK